MHTGRRLCDSHLTSIRMALTRARLIPPIGLAQETFLLCAEWVRCARLYELMHCALLHRMTKSWIVRLPPTFPYPDGETEGLGPSELLHSGTRALGPGSSVPTFPTMDSRFLSFLGPHWHDGKRATSAIVTSPQRWHVGVQCGVFM